MSGHALFCSAWARRRDDGGSGSGGEGAGEGDREGEGDDEGVRDVVKDSDGVGRCD